MVKERIFQYKRYIIKIIILEDEGIMSLFLKETLKKLGHEVLATFSDASSLMNYLNLNSNVDLVLTDILIHGETDGIQTANFLKKTYNIPVIFITAYKDSDTISCAQTATPIAYLIKPVTQNELEATLMVAEVSIRNKSMSNNLVNISDYTYNKSTQTISENSQHIKLSKKEKVCLENLIKNKNKYVSKEYLNTSIWNDDNKDNNEKSLRELVYRIRQKLPKLVIENNYNLGYSLKTSLL